MCVYAFRVHHGVRIEGATGECRQGAASGEGKVAPVRKPNFAGEGGAMVSEVPKTFWGFELLGEAPLVHFRPQPGARKLQAAKSI